MTHGTSKRYPLILLGLALALAAVCAIGPNDRADWALENALALVSLAVLVLTYRRFPFSKVSYTTIFAMFVLHQIGAHYTYSLVPYDAWFESVAGRSLNGLLGFERNHYDRLVHFSYGLLLAYPIRELVVRVAEVRGFWGYFFPLDVILSTSLLYELIEWAAALAFGGELGIAYLGTQGDVWDAQKDMALAALGAVVALSITAAIHYSVHRDFHREWAQSLSARNDPGPLGEEALARMKARG
jgi:putative membrane protein